MIPGAATSFLTEVYLNWISIDIELDEKREIRETQREQNDQ